jgi:mono/diheme cytochrome c family protein
MIKRLSLLLASLLTMGVVAAAQERTEELAASGRKFALSVCGNCHLVEKGQKPPILKPPAPAFAALASRGTYDEQKLRRFLSGPHANYGRSQKMPNPQLADFEVDEVVAYFLQLKARSR